MGFMWKTGAVALLTAGAWAAELSQTWATFHQRGIEAFEAQRFAEALEAFEKALPLASTPAERAATLNDIGNSLRGEGRSAEAIERLKEAVEGWRAIDAQSSRAAETAVSLGNAQSEVGQAADAERTLRTALEAKPRDAERQASILNTLADLLREQDRLVEAKGKFELALELSPGAGQNRMDALVGLADVERCASQWSDSIRHWNQALAIAREQRATDVEALALRGLGKTYADAGDLRRSEPLLRRALDLFDKQPLLVNHSAGTLDCLAELYREEKKYGLAEEAALRALKLQGGMANANSPAAAVTFEILAGVTAMEKRLGEAADYARRGEEIMRKSFPADRPPVAGALASKAFVEDRSGDLDSAERDYGEALRILRANELEATEMTAEFKMQYASVLRRLHRRRDAKALETQVKAFREPGK